MLKKDKENIYNKLNGTLIEEGFFSKDDDMNTIKIISNLRPNLPLLKVKKYIVEDYNYGNMKNIKAESKEDLYKIGTEKENYFSYKKKENIYKNPLLLEMAYNNAKDISQKIDLNKDIKHLIVLSMDISKEKKLVLSNVKLEKIKRNNLVDLDKIDIKYKEKPLKISRNIANKIYDKKFFYDELSKEYRIKENINKKVKDKEKLSYFGYTNDIIKMNKTLKNIIKATGNKKYNKNRLINNKDVEVIIDFNSLGNEKDKKNLQIIDNLYNFESLGSTKLSKALDNNISYNSLINEKDFKRENDTVKRIIGNKNYILTEDMEKEKSNIEYFKDKKKEILGFQMAIATDKLTPENTNIDFLSDINTLSKTVLNKTKSTLSMERKEGKKVDLINDISQFNKKNLEKLCKKDEIKDNFYKSISKENISEVLKDKQIIRLVVEWDYKQENKEKQEEQKSAVIIDTDDLLKINKEIIFADKRMEKNRLFFKLYITDESTERIVNLNNYNDNIDENDEELEEKIKNKIVADYFEEQGYYPKKEDKWSDEDRRIILNRLNDDYRKELIKKSLTEDNSLENTIKKYVAISDNFKNLYYSLENTVNMHSSLNDIGQTSLGANFVSKIQNYIINENEFLKENYKYRNEKILDYLQVEELIDNELSLKRQTKELDFFVENQPTIVESYNLKFDLDKDGNVADKKEYSKFNFGFNNKVNNDKKLDKNTEFTQNNTKIDTDIEILPIISREIKKKNMIIKKNNSEYLEMLKEIEMSL